MANEPSAVVEAFSLTHAQILDGTQSFVEAALATTTPEELDIYGVQQASIAPKIDDWENEGDDDVLSYWAWLKYAEVQVEAGYISFKQIAKMTNQTISSGGSGAGIMYGLDLWGDDGMNVAPFPMITKMPSKDRDGKIRTLTVGLYKVQFAPMEFDGPKYKEGLKVKYAGRALKSAVDEKGVAFPDGKKRVGRLLSHA